jgi:hypothetical protein
LFAFEHFQMRQEVKEQQESHLPTFFKGTKEYVYCIHEYNNTSFDGKNDVEATGHDNQTLPSGLSLCKDAPANNLLGDFILEHQSMSGVAAPDLPDERVGGYGRVLGLT